MINTQTILYQRRRTRMVGIDFLGPSLAFHLNVFPTLTSFRTILKNEFGKRKDINLATLLIPRHDNNINKNHEQTQTQGGIICHVSLNSQEDSPLHKSLSISEFITAFGKYKSHVFEVPRKKGRTRPL